MYSGIRRGITQIPDALLPRAGDLSRPGTPASAELGRPLVRYLEETAAFTADQDLALCVEPTLLGESDGLGAAPVRKQLRASVFMS